MSQGRVYDAAVVGAGPTGLTIANYLGRAGRKVVLIERHETTVREPRAVSIDDESLRTMQAIGLAEKTIAQCALDYGSHYFTASGVCFAKVEPTTREYGFPRRNAFTQPRLEETLRAGLDRFANVEQRFSHDCEEVSQDADVARLKVRMADGGVEEIAARYVVGADGARSMFRKAIGATLSGSTYEQPWLIVDLASTQERMRQTRVVCDPRRPFITLPGPDGIRRYEFMLNPGESEDQATDVEFVRALLAASGPDAQAEIVRKQVYTFHARVADSWRRGRILIAGDAAHLSPPFAGQGMNSGLRDAHNLAWKLEETIAGRLGERLLDTYRQERAPHAQALIDLAINMGRIMMPTSPAQAALVQGAFRLMRFAPALHAYFAQMKYKPKPFYTQGFVVNSSEERLAGRMIAQPLVERTDRSRVMLDDLFGDGFVLLAYGPEAHAALDEAMRLEFALRFTGQVAVLPAGVNPDLRGPCLEKTVRDVSDLLAGVFGLHDKATRVMIVRPDRYVCAAANVRELPALQALVRRLVEGCAGRCAAEAGEPSSRRDFSVAK